MNKRLIIYLSMGIGDFYNMLTIIPALCNERKIKKEDIYIYVDSIYFNDIKFENERETVSKLILSITNKENIFFIPTQIGTFLGIKWKDVNYEHRYGPRYENIKNEFLFYRRQETKDYMKNILKEGDIFIYSLLGEFIYEWKDGMNVPINHYPRARFFIQLNEEQEEKINKYLQEKPLLIHIRYKKDYSNNEFYNKIFDFCEKNNIKCIVIGLKDRGFAGAYEKIKIKDSKNIINLMDKLSFEEVFNLTQKAEHMITSNSGFAYHRLMFGKQTIILSPEEFGVSKVIFSEEQLNNKNYIFLNSSEPIIDKTIKILKDWYI